MKTLFNNTSNTSNFINGINNNGSISDKVKTNSTEATNYHSLRTTIKRKDLLTPSTYLQMQLGQIPDLWNVCLDLFNTFLVKDAPYSALQFVPVLKNLQSIDAGQICRFLLNPDTNHVLIQNDLLKVVLIHWKPGKISSIHGHPQGGCVFKVLQGQLEEMRYTTDASPKLLSSSTFMPGGMAYIDDKIGYHAVGNPFNAPAISLHAYTPGIKK